MKKIYINPETTVVKIELQQMIAESGPEVTTETYTEGDPVDAKGFGFGFFEEEEMSEE